MDGFSLKAAIFKFKDKAGVFLRLSSALPVVICKKKKVND